MASTEDATLRALCEAAKTVRWRHDGRGNVIEDLSDEECPGTIAVVPGSLREADFIAAANPHAVEELLDRFAEAERRAEEAEEARDAAGAHADSVEDRLRSQKAIAEAAEAKLAVAVAALEHYAHGLDVDVDVGLVAREALAAVEGKP